MNSRLAYALLATSAITWSGQAYAQATVTAGFSSGAVADYITNPNQTSNGVLFSSLSISSIQISQNSSNGAWGGSQGNDTAVTVTIAFSDGRPPLSFAGAINWVKNAGGGEFDWVGITTNVNVNDGYTPSAGASRTYILQFSRSTLDLASLIPNDLDGSANTGQALSALNRYFPGGQVSFTSTNSSSGGNPSYSFDYAENRTQAVTLGTVGATGGSGTRTFSITGGNPNGWYAINASTGAISLTAAGAASLANDFEQTPNAHTVTVQVTDGTTSATTAVALNETDLADPPLVFTGTNATNGGSPSYSFDYAENRAAGATLGSVAANGGSGTRTFSITGGNPNGWFAIDPSTGAITLTTAGAASLANDFELTPNAQALTVQVTDGTSTTSIQVALSETDLADAPLVFTGTNATSGGSPSYSFDYQENRAAGESLGSVAATGGVGTRSFSITGGNADGWYAIDSSTGEISLTASGAASLANDFEQTPNIRALTVQVTDGTSSGSVQVALNETDVADAPLAFTGSNATSGGSPSYRFDYAENRAAGASLGSVAATGGAGTRSFSITGGNTNGWYAINGSTGEISLTAAGAASLANDFEQAPNAQALTVQVSDGTSSASIQVALNETDVADAPLVFTGTNTMSSGTPSYSFDYAENRVAGATLGNVGATGGSGTRTFTVSGGNTNGWFAIDASTGAITLTAAGAASLANDFGQAPNTQTLIVQVSDGTSTATIEVALNETDLADAQLVFTGTNATSGGSPSYSFDYAENRTAGATLGSVAATGGTGSRTYSITGGNANGWYALDASTGAITLTAAGAASLANDFEQVPNAQTFTVQVGDGTSTATIQVALSETDLDDAGPAITGPSGGPGASSSTISVNEGQMGVTRLAAGEPVTWSIVGGPDASRFTVGPDGTITFVATPDHESPVDGGTNNEYEIVVEARDAAGNVTTQAITVTVLDLDDAGPAISGPSGGPGATSSTLSVNEGQTGVTRLTAGEPVTWSIVGGPDASRFAIAPDGTITFAAAPDHESPVDGGTNNEYEIIVEARDAAGNVTTQAIIVTVLDVDDSGPAITGPSGGPGAANSRISVNEGQTGVAQLIAAEPVTWSIIGGADASRFAIAPNGTITFVATPDHENPADRGTDNDYEIIVEARDAAGNVTTQAIIVSVFDLDDTGPAITGPSGGAGAANSSLSVDEGQTAVARLTAGEPVTWTIAAGPDASRFAITPDGTITFVAVPDHENPSDRGTDNVYEIIVEARDAAGNVTAQAITVTVLDLDDARPSITGPSGGPGASRSSLSVDEGQTGVTRLSAGEPVTWSITGGPDASRFAIAPDGTITFIAAPDHESPVDRGTDNEYEIIVEARDAAGNVTTQAIVVTVVDRDDTPPAITGPSGSAGAASSTISVNEGQAGVTRLSAGEPVTWSIVGGPDASRFAIAADGTVTFIAAPDHENPTDSNHDNSYVLEVRAVDSAGNESRQSITVIVLNFDEIGARLGEIGGQLRGSLRGRSFDSLGTMLAFNENLVQQGNQDDCTTSDRPRPLSGGASAGDTSQNLALNHSRRLNGCGGRLRIYGDFGFAVSRFDGDWTVRTLGAVRAETWLGDDVTVGVGVLGTIADDRLDGFSEGNISDSSLQLNVYGRARLTNTLRAGAFAGFGRAWYDFQLTDDGFSFRGQMSGWRHVYGASLAGDIRIDGTIVTTEILLSRASEQLGSARIAGEGAGERREGIAFAVGTVDATRLSIPVHVPFVLASNEATGRSAVLALDPGLLCEDRSADLSNLTCGYQLGARLDYTAGSRNRGHVDVQYESVASNERYLVSFGFSRVLGRRRGLELGVMLGQTVASSGQDYRAIVQLRGLRF